MPATRPVDMPELRAGTVTALETQQNDPERVSVFIDGQYAFGLAWDLAVQAGLRKGQHLSQQQQQALLEEEQRLRARRVALDYIAYRARTAEEVRRKLARKGFPEDAVEAAVARMAGLGYLDDEAYARTYVRSKLSGRGYGPERLRADLRRRGVAPAVVEAALAEMVEPDDLRETALQQGRQRWQRLASEADPAKRRKKLSDFLARRGYGFDLIREVAEVLEREE
jgi:regulatory protein